MRIEVIEEHEGFDIIVESKTVLGRGNTFYTLMAKDGGEEVLREELGWASVSALENSVEAFKERCSQLRDGEPTEDTDDSSEDEEEVTPEDEESGGTPPPLPPPSDDS